MASCGACIYPPVQCTPNLYTISQSHLLSSPITSSSHTKWVARHFPALRQSRFCIRRDKLVLRRWRIECSAADAASSSAGASDESPYQVLGVSPLEKFDTIKATYRRKHKDAERQGNEAAMARFDQAYDRIMMTQLSNRKQGLTFGSFEVSKEIKYADKRSWFPWGPKVAQLGQKEVLMNLAISAFFSIWMVSAGEAEWKPLQFLIFSYMFRIFNKLKEYEPASSSISSEDEDGSRRTKSGKRLLRTLGLVFGCVGLASLAFTGTLNMYELLGQYIPRSFLGAQELFVTVVSAVALFIIGSFFR
ncbi:unnamed protein product [Sphagnum compactum]